MRAQRRLAGLPAVVGLVVGLVLVLRLRALDDVLLTRDVQVLLLAITLLALAAAAVLALLGLALRRLLSRSPHPTGWWLAPAWLAWWLTITVLLASCVIGFWLVATTGDFWA